MSDLPVPTQSETSPLDEAKADSLEDLFNKDPLHLTEQDLERTVAYFRQARTTFLAQDATKVPKSAKGKASPAPVKKDMDVKLTADDLDLD